MNKIRDNVCEYGYVTVNHTCVKGDYMESGGCAVGRRTVNRGDDVSMPPTAVSKLRQFRSPPHLPVSFGKDTKSRWSLLSSVYARGSKRSHTGGKCITCSRFINYTEEQLLCVNPSLDCLEVTT